MNALSTYPLTRRQKLVLLSQSLSPQSPIFHLAFEHRIFAAIDPERFEAAFTRLVLCTDAFRTVIEPGAQGGYDARVRSGVPTQLEFHDVSTYSDPESAMGEIRDSVVWREFDLTRSPYASWLFKLGPQNFAWALKIHHVVFDGVSAQLLFKRLERLYKGQGHLPKQPLFGDYAQSCSVTEEADAAYWKERLASVDTTFSLYGEQPNGQIFEVESFEYQLPKETVEKITCLAQEVPASDLSFNARQCGVLALVLGVYLCKAAQSKKLAIALTHHGRRKPTDSQVIGLFTQMLPLIFEMDSQRSFRSLLPLVLAEFSETLTHPDYSFANPVNEHLMHVGFNYRQRRHGEFMGGGVETRWFHSGLSEFGFSLDAIKSESGLQNLVLRIGREFLPGWQRDVAARQFYRLLDELLENPDCPIASFSLLTPREKQQMVVDWNDTAQPYPQDQCLHRLFEQQVLEMPESVALIENQAEISYQQLNRLANRIAHELLKLGVAKGDRVGVLMPRSSEMVATLLGILKTGGVYLPLDVDDPSARIDNVLSEASAAFLVSQEAWLEKVAERTGLKVLDLRVVDTSGPDYGNPEASAHAGDVLNCLFTSGSSGPAKGVLGTHRGAVNVITWLQQQFPFRPGEVACLKTTFCFVDFVWELFGPLLAGTPTLLVPEVMVRDPRKLLPFLAENRVSRLVVVPSLLSALMVDGTGFESLKWCFVGGEPLTRNLATSFGVLYPNARMVNVYGSTEGTGIATFWESENRPGTPPIGRPIANTIVRILDKELNLLPPGAWGELYVGGVSLAQGYLNDPSLTVKKFIADPITGQGVLYRTGDLARYLPDGQIECRGRVDRQLKIRGFRIEPAEIEHLLGQHEAVLAARVESVRIHGDAEQIVAWIAASANTPPGENEIRHFLRERLPAHMVPALFVFLPELPVNSRGKVDGAALRSELVASLADRAGGDAASEMEQTVMDCWKRFLPESELWPHSNFFEIGGDSLLAAQVLVALERQLGCQIPLGTMIEASTPRLLAAAIALKEGDIGDCSAVQLQRGTSGRTLFLTPTIGGALFRYRHLLKHLPDGLNVTGLQINRLDSGPDGEIDFQKIALEMMGALKAIQPRGPYLLAGFCFGGVLSLELACMLEREGEQVDFLGLVETWAPGFMERSRHARKINDLDRDNWLGRLSFHLHGLWELGWRERWHYINKSAGRKLGAAPPVSDSGTSSNLLLLPSEIQALNLRALRAYKPRAYRGEVSLFRAHHSWHRETERDLGWSPWLKGRVHIVDVPGFHTFVLEDPWVRRLGRTLTASLEGRW